MMLLLLFKSKSIFSGCFLIGRSHQANHSASPAKRYLRWLDVLCFQPFRQFFSMHGVAVYSANMAKLPRSKASLYSRAARERGRTFFRGVANNTPYYGCCTLSGLPSESKARSFSQKLNVVHASLRE